MTYYSKGEIAKDILICIGAVGIAMVVVALPGIAMISKLFPKEDYKTRYKAERSLKTLEKNKYIRRYKKNGEVVVEITRKGKRKILKYKFNDMSITKPKNWDGKWRMVIFDVPERSKCARNAISHKLKELEFYPLQKSVFVFPYECRNEIDFIGAYFNIRKNIQYIEIAKIDCENKLKRKFKL